VSGVVFGGGPPLKRKTLELLFGVGGWKANRKTPPTLKKKKKETRPLPLGMLLSFFVFASSKCVCVCVVHLFFLSFF
jgi:hypothetical protein